MPKASLMLLEKPGAELVLGQKNPGRVYFKCSFKIPFRIVFYRADCNIMYLFVTRDSPNHVHCMEGKLFLYSTNSNGSCFSTSQAISAQRPKYRTVFQNFNLGRDPQKNSYERRNYE